MLCELKEHLQWTSQNGSSMAAGTETSFKDRKRQNGSWKAVPMHASLYFVSSPFPCVLCSLPDGDGQLSQNCNAS